MCGIAGFEINGVDTPTASAALLDALAARAPDGSWAAVRGSFALVETRLAVIDLSEQRLKAVRSSPGAQGTTSLEASPARA